MSASLNFPEDYLEVLRTVGLSDNSIAELHDLEYQAAETRLEAVINEAHSDIVDPAQATRQLINALSESPVGVKSPGQYWNTAPGVHLDNAFSFYGISLEIKPIGDDRGYYLYVTDAGGSRYKLRFQYPASPLGDNNYPALVATIEQKLLSENDLTFLRLKAPKNEWRFVLLPASTKQTLQEKFGSRISVFDQSILADAQPDDFVDNEDIPVPSWYSSSTSEPKSSTAEITTVHRTETFWKEIAQEESEDPDDVLSSNSSTEGEIDISTLISDSAEDTSELSDTDGINNRSNETAADNLEELSMPDPSMGSAKTKSTPSDELVGTTNTDGPAPPPGTDATDPDTAGVEQLLSDLKMPEKLQEEYASPPDSKEPEDNNAVDEQSPGSANSDTSSDTDSSFLEKVEEEAAGISRRVSPDDAVCTNQDDAEIDDDDEDSTLESLLRKLT